MFVYPINFYNSILLTLALTLPGGHRVSIKPVGFIFSLDFLPNLMKFGMVMKPLSLNFLRHYFLSEGGGIREMTAGLLSACKKDMHSDSYKSMWFKLSVMIDVAEFYVLIFYYLSLTLIQGHRDARKQKLLHKLFPQVINGFGWNFVLCTYKRQNFDVMTVSLYFFVCCECSWLSTCDRLVGLVVKASASRAEGPGFESCLRQDFFGVESYQ